jgi:hypothetical protein
VCVRVAFVLGEVADHPTDHAWKFGFAREVLSSLIDQAFGAKAPAYNTIIMLDKVGKQWSPRFAT